MDAAGRIRVAVSRDAGAAPDVLALYHDERDVSFHVWQRIYFPVKRPQITGAGVCAEAVHGTDGINQEGVKKAFSKKNLWDKTPPPIKAVAGAALSLVPLPYLLGGGFRKWHRFAKEA